MNFIATKARVFTRGIPPDEFLTELVNWARTAADEIFAPNPNPDDIYARIEPQLGPWPDIIQRKAAICEALRVLAGFESSWGWTEGRDTTAGPETPVEMEAGAWQESANSIVFGMDLKALVLADDGSIDPIKFQATMKSNHQFAMEYTARLLRHTVHANGPVVRNEINPWLSRAAQAEFVTLLTS